MFIFSLTLSSFLLMSILSFVSLSISEKGLNFKPREEISSYECGFEHNSLSRIPLSIRYFLLTVVFLIFDLEIVLLVFMSYSILLSVSLCLLLLMSISFISVLFMGLVYEWIDGSLEWVM